MADNDPTDNERQAKLLAARRKLKKFQKKMDGETESSNKPMSQDQVGILFTDRGTPLVKRADSPSVKVDTPFFIPSPPNVVLPTFATQPKDTPERTQATQPTDTAERIQALEQENTLLKEQYRQAQNELETRVLKATELTKEHDNQVQTINDYRQKVSVLEKINQDHQDQIDTLHKTNNELQQQIDGLDKVKADQQQQIDTLQESNDDFHTEINRMIEMVSELEESLAGTQAANYTKECEIKSLQSALHDLSTSASTRGIMDRLDTVTNERDALQTRIQQFEQSLVDTNNKDMDDLQERHSQEIKELQEQHSAAMTTLEGKHKAAITVLEEKVATAISSSETKEQGLGVLMDSVQHLERARAALKDQLDNKNQIIKRLEQLNETKDKELETSGTELTRLEQQYTVIQQTLDDQQAYYKNLQETKHDAYDKQIERIQAQIKNVSDRYERIESATTMVEHGIKTSLEERQILEMELANTRKQWAKEQAKVANLNQQIYQIHKRLATEHGYEWIHVPGQSPFIGPLPPLVKPAFSEFLETPRCSGCQSDAIDI